MDELRIENYTLLHFQALCQGGAVCSIDALKLQAFSGSAALFSKRVSSGFSRVPPTSENIPVDFFFLE